jgi:hypothetical protein
MKRVAIVCILGLALLASAAGARTKAELPTGVFKATITDADLKAGHVPRSDWKEDHGAYTITLRPGRFVWAQKAPNPLQVPVSSGTVTDLTTNAVEWKTTKPASQAGFVIIMTWTYSGRLLRFRVDSPKDPQVRTVLDAHPWRKVG